MSVWFRPIGTHDPSRLNLIWLPHAGGGSSQLIRSARLFQPDANLWSANLPGREGRFNDPRPESFESLVASLVSELPDFEAPYLLMGHSFGGLLAYEIARRISHAEKVEESEPFEKGKSAHPAALVLMAISSPDRLKTDASISHLEDDEFAERLDNRYGGVPKTLRENAEAMKLFLPTVRHDLQLLESYDDHAPARLDIPILALAGIDDSAASAARMQGWRSRTDSRFRLQSLPGDHFFPLAQFQTVIRLAKSLVEST